MKRLAVVVSAALAALICVMPGSASAGVALPPDLVTLEQQMAQLQVNSERFSLQEEISLGSALGQGIPLVLIVAGDGEASDAPPQALVNAGIPGFGAPEQVRIFGETTYTYRQSAARTDGGRPWVRGRTKSKGVSPLDPGGIAGSGEGGKQGTFTKLIEQLNGALSIDESGPATVDDQRVTEFDAALDPAPVLAELQAHSKKSTPHPLNSLLHIPSVGGPQSTGKPEPAPTLELELFVAPNGLPVRTRVTLSAEGATIAVRFDTLAINVPVDVAPPPAAKTIDEAQLKRIERRDAARARVRLLRFCRRQHGRSARSCRAAARAEPRSESQSESSSPLL